MAIVEFGYRPALVNRGLGGVLDHSRWIAALAVCCAHLRNLLFPDFAGGSAVTRLFYFITLFGTQAVVIFFVASGLLVGGSILRAINKGHFDRHGYAIDRAARLYVVLVPALLLTEGLRLAGMAMTCTEPQNMAALATNFFFLQNFSGSPLCNNHPLWSLSSEAFFYLIGPALLFASLKRSAWGIGLATLLLLFALHFWSLSYATPLFGLLLWLMGLVPWFVSVRVPPWLGLAPFATILLLSRMHHTFNEFFDAFALAASFSFFLCCRFRDKPVPLGGLATALAGFSYSLYLVHMPIAQAITEKLGHRLVPGSIRSLLVYDIALLGIIAVAWLFGRLFEDHTKAVRNWLRTLTGPGVHMKTATPSQDEV